MLWSKEETANDSYVDIFTQLDGNQWSTEATSTSRNEADDREFDQRSKRFNQKFEQYAEECRDEGKSLFGKKNYIKAMQEFNRCLMFARPGSQEISMALANRSACFFYLNMPNECLIDIEMAKASNYPAYLRHKLDDRAAKCHTLLNENVQSVIREPALSFWAHEQYDGVADCLKIQANDEFGHHIRTICDLDIGQIILIEQPFSIVPTKFSIQNRDRCFYCFSQLKNFITCTDCLKGFYCNVGCMKRAHHQIECSIDVILDESEQIEIELVVKTFLNVNAAFDDPNVMMKIVNLLLNESDLPDNLTPTQRNFCILFKLRHVTHDAYTDDELSELKRKSAIAHQIIASHSDIKLKFSSVELQRFIQHLIFHLFSIVEHAINLNESMRKDSKPILASYSLEHYATAFYSFGCHIRHSCIPNVSWFCAGNRLVCTVIRPIKKGEQLLRSFL